MPRGQLKNYKIGNRSYSITQLLDYEGVREVVSSCKTEGSTGPSTYGAQRARAGEPIRTNTGVETEGPHHFHDPFYEGNYNPNSPPPMDRRYGGQKNGPLRNNRGQIIYGPRKRRNRLGRGTMYFNGVRISASRARQTFLRLVKRLTNGKNLANSTIESKIRRAYKQGIPQSDLSMFKAHFDKRRKLDRDNTTVTHHIIENPDRSLDLRPFLEETAPEVVQLMDEHPNTKAQYLLQVYFRDDKEDVENPTPFPIYLNSDQVTVRAQGENWEVYSVISQRILQAYQHEKFAKSRLGLGHIVKGTITLSEIDAQGEAGEYFPLPRWLAVKKALVNIQVSEDRCFANAVVRSLNIEKKNYTRLTPLLRKKIAELDWTGVQFPTPLEGESIRNFEENNNIGVAIYTSGENDEGENVVIRKRSPSKRFGQIANIFLMTVFENSEAKHHFCTISRLSALIKEQGRRDGARYCSYCSARFFHKFARERKEKGNKKQKRIGIIKTHQRTLCGA